MLTLTDRYYDIDSEAPLTEMFDRCKGETCHKFLRKVHFESKVVETGHKYVTQKHHIKLLRNSATLNCYVTSLVF